MKDESTLFIFFNLVSTFPQLVNLVSWICLAIALFFFWCAYSNGMELIKANVGIKQDEHHIKKIFTYSLFAILLWNIEWFTAVLTNAMGFKSVVDGGDKLDYLKADIFQDTTGMSDMLSYVIWICNMIGFISLPIGMVKLNYAVINPQPKAFSRGMMMIIFSVALLRIKDILSLIALILRSDSLSKWLGYSGLS